MTNPALRSREIADRLANWFFLALAAVLIAAATVVWNYYDTLGWLLATVAIVTLAFAIFAPHSRKATVLDAVVTFVMALRFLG